MMFAVDVRVEEHRPLRRVASELMAFLPVLPSHWQSGSWRRSLPSPTAASGSPPVRRDPRPDHLPPADGRPAALGGAGRAARARSRPARRSCSSGSCARSSVALGMRDRTTRTPRRRRRPLRQGPGGRDRLQRGGTGHRPRRGPAARDRQVHLARPRPALRCSPRRTWRPSATTPRRARPGRRARRIRPCRRRDPLPPRAVDGRGYPAGLIGKEIPLASRILAICSVYDTMTAREQLHGPAYDPRGSDRRAAAGQPDGQLDGDLVETFMTVLEREGLTFAQDQMPTSSSELDFERRVRELAEPSVNCGDRPQREKSRAPAIRDALDLNPLLLAVPTVRPLGHVVSFAGPTSRLARRHRSAPSAGATAIPMSRFDSG